MWLLLARLALATPTFVSEDDPRAAELATRAWKAATACAGWEAHAYDRVVIEHGAVKGGFAGRAHTAKGRRVWLDGAGNVVREDVVAVGGLYLIELVDTQPRTVAHEVAHAWIHAGPPALVEGATELLADCIAEREPKAFPATRAGGTLAGLVDLRDWRNDMDTTDGREAGYVAAARLFRVAARLVPREHLWRSSWTWDEFLDALSHHGDAGAALRAAIEGGVDTQRAALDDADHDGRLGIEETWGDPPPTPPATARIAVPPGMLAVPGDGSVVCAGVAAGFAGARVRLAVLDASGAAGRASLYAGVVPVALPASGDAPIPAGASVLLAAASPVWVRVEGPGLVPDTGCADAPTWTVVADGRVDLDAFVAALAGIRDRAEVLLGPSPGRLVVRIGDAEPGTVARSVEVPPAWLSRDPRYAAALAEARLRADTTASGPEPAFVEALARALADAPPGGPWLAGDTAEVDGWAEEAARCGWAAVLADACGSSP